METTAFSPRLLPGFPRPMPKRLPLTSSPWGPDGKGILGEFQLSQVHTV